MHFVGSFYLHRKLEFLMKRMMEQLLKRTAHVVEVKKRIFCLIHLISLNISSSSVSVTNEMFGHGENYMSRARNCDSLRQCDQKLSAGD